MLQKNCQLYILNNEQDVDFIFGKMSIVYYYSIIACTVFVPLTSAQFNFGVNNCARDFCTKFWFYDRKSCKNNGLRRLAELSSGIFSSFSFK